MDKNYVGLVQNLIAFFEKNNQPKHSECIDFPVQKKIKNQQIFEDLKSEKSDTSVARKNSVQMYMIRDRDYSKDEKFSPFCHNDRSEDDVLS